MNYELLAGDVLLPKNPNLEINFDLCNLKEIFFAGGCFWGTDAYLARVKGVYDTKVGYANGNTEYPSYEDVCKKGTGHAEVVRVSYSPDIVSLAELAEVYFSVIDPTILNRQGGDIGTQYRTGMYYTDPGDRAVLETVKNKVQSGLEKTVVTEILPLDNFYEAEEYHQKYLEKNPGGYCHISFDGMDTN